MTATDGPAPAVFDDRERRLLAGRARSLACRRRHRADGDGNDRADGNVGDSGDGDGSAHVGDAVPDRGVSDEQIADAWASTGEVPSDLAASLADQSWPADRPLPAWVSTAETVIGRVIAAGPPRHDLSEAPFGWVYARVADAAVAGLPETVPRSVLTPAVRWFVDRVHGLSRRLLYVAFRRHLATTTASPVGASPDPSAYDDPPTAGYESFLAAFADGGARRLALRYPVWTRQVATLTRQWRAHVTELWERLGEAPTDVFDTSGAPTALRPLADDSHAHGRVPWLIEFERGSVVYKPRRVDGLELFWDARAELDDHLSVTLGDRPPIRNCKDHAWVGVVEGRDLTPGDARQYYRRAGVTLALAARLGLTDCGRENVVADGAVPTVVDAETVLQPTRERSSPAAAFVDDTVFSTGLLPHRTLATRRRHAASTGFDPGRAAGLGTGDSSAAEAPAVPRLVDVNTDLMRVVDHEPTVDTDQNTPTVDGVPATPHDHVDELVAGFREAHHTLTRLCDGEDTDEADDPGPLGEFVSAERLRSTDTRVLVRTTSRYTRLLHRATKRVHLASGVGFDAALADLAPDGVDPTAVGRRDAPTTADDGGRTGATGDDSPAHAQFAAERRALWRRDVPRFSLSPTERRPTHDGVPAGPVFSEDGLTALRRRCDAADGADCRRGVAAIRAAFDERRDGSLERLSPPPEAVVPTDDRLADLAQTALGRVLDAETRAGWVFVDSAVPVWLVDADRSAYYGVGGLLLAAAAVAAATGDSRARRAVPRLRTRLSDADDGPRPLGLTGVAGTVYAATVTAELVDDDAARRLATRELACVDTARITDADRHSVLEGTAGLLGAAVAHAARTDAAAAWRVAHDCARRLLAVRRDHDGHAVWPTADGVETGFGHGQSGIAAVLARYARRAGDADAARVAADTLAWVRHHDPADHGVDEETDGSDSRTVPSWCRGTTGQQLGRRVAATSLRSQTAVDGLPTEPAALDSLCCGTLGRVDALLFAARHGDGDTTAARRLLGRLLARRATTGRLEITGHDPLLPNVSLFHGVAGAAYVAARALDPSVPAVVTLQ